MQLTDADRALLIAGKRENGGFHLLTKWYFMGWEPLWYQYLWHQAPMPGGLPGETIPNTTFLAGIASGKTTNVASSYFSDCLTIPYFRALNTSVTAKQSELPFETAQAWIEGNPRLEPLIEGIALRPYPTISFRNGSEWVFRTAGKDARFIRGMEFDRLNYDEAGLDFVGEAVKVLRGRLRGRRMDGAVRMARMDVTTSPTSAPWLEERFERGWKENEKFDPSQYLSLRISTFMNTRLTRQQIELMVAEYSDDMIDVELRALFPDYGMSLFPRAHVQACTDQSLNDAVEMALHPEDGSKPKAGYRIEEHPRHGITKFEIPPEPGAVYVMAGDPGIEGPPKRNSPCVMVMEISRKPNRVVYFDWVDGKGSYNPFLLSYKYAMRKYRPILKGMDTTGTQKAIDELAFENMGLEVDGINFQRDKEAMLNSLNAAITNHAMSWPAIRGLIKQTSSYSRENEKKLTQDIVMTMAQLAFLERHIGDMDTSPEDERYKATATYPRQGRTRRTTVNRRRR
jgi:hypothetical protein